jgi:hypothetical protein
LTAFPLASYVPLRIVWLKKEARSILPVLGGVLAVSSWQTAMVHGIPLLLADLTVKGAVLSCYLGLVLYLHCATGNTENDGSEEGACR